MNWCENDNIEIAHKCPGCEKCGGLMTVNIVNQFGELMSVDFGDRGRCEHGHLLPIAHDWTECIQCEEEWGQERMRLLWLEHTQLVVFSRIEK